MPETKRSTFRLGPLVESLIDQYRGKKNRTEWIKEAILEKAQRESKKKLQNTLQ